MNFPVFSQLAGNFGFPETGSLETASSSKESANFRSLSGGRIGMRITAPVRTSEARLRRASRQRSSIPKRG